MQINHLPALPIDVIHPVWVAWDSRHGAVVDATSGAKLLNIAQSDTAAVSSLSDRSVGACLPPFGVLTRSEIKHLVAPVAGTHPILKYMSYQTFSTMKAASVWGNCTIVLCEPDMPVWVVALNAPDQPLQTGGCRTPGGSACSSPQPASWRLSPADARTGPQHSGSNTIGGSGPLPAQFTSLPDLDPAG